MVKLKSKTQFEKCHGYPSFDDESIGSRMKVLRMKRGLKASWVAEEMGLKGPMLTMLEAGQRHWTKEKLANFKKAIGV